MGTVSYSPLYSITLSALSSIQISAGKRKILELFKIQESTTLTSSTFAERRGFEPPIPFGVYTFQACLFNHSSTSPFFRSKNRTNFQNQQIFESTIYLIIPRDTSINRDYASDTPPFLILSNRTAVITIRTNGNTTARSKMPVTSIYLDPSA